MDDSKQVMNTGLRGVKVASTRISDVNGAEGKLVYRGYLVRDMAEKVCFEEVVHLLLYETMPSAGALADLRTRLRKEREITDGVFTAMRTFPRDALPMDVLQAAVSLLAGHDPDTRTLSRETALNMALRLIARLPVLVAAWERIRNGNAPIAPHPDMSHAANFLYMLNGRVPEEDVARFFDVALVLHAEHSFNASTFSARQIASTKAHMYAAIAGAVGSLSGELHGGANTRVMQMLLKIGAVENVEPFVNQVLETGGLIMGLGHAVYDVDDPRARILAPMSKVMGERAGDARWYELSRVLEEKAKAAFRERKGRDIFVNVDFYSASLYYAMGIPMDMFTPVFAIARVAGWAAHVIEEQFAGAAPKPVLYRPESEYTGEYCGPAECVFVPLNER